ncbi:hypothetical protein GOODEAATRI_019782, partial [Goodea atripinnis]
TDQYCANLTSFCFTGFPNNEKRKLVHLSGTLPVLYQGSQYNVPVCIWLHETHPASRPRCFVCPSVSMVINLSCPYVDSSGTITLDGLKNWTPGVSNLSLLLSEMMLAFQKDTPLYARCVAQAPPPAGVQVSVEVSSSSSLQSQCLSLGSSYPAPLKGNQMHRGFILLVIVVATATNGITSSETNMTEHVSKLSPAPSFAASRWGQGSVRTSYTEELIGIDFSVPLTEALSRMMGALSLDRDRQSELAQHGSGAQSPQSGPATEADLRKMSDAGLSPDQAAVFLALITMNGRSFNTDDVIEAVQHNQDFPSALKFLTHTCPICHDQVSFSKIITMTHCSCFLCQSCFTSFFSVAIKERSVDQLTCPQCGQPEIRGQGALEESMDYFNLLDTQIRHFLPPDVHELFQRKLRDRALQEMPNFCWCAHVRSSHTRTRT